jgi:hypothetical protein
MRIKCVEDDWTDGSKFKWCIVVDDTVTHTYDTYIQAWRHIKYQHVTRMFQLHVTC